jgi:hypothetical protein
MRIDADQIIDSILPWDCTLVLGGTEYRVRPLTLADMIRLERVTAAGRTLGEMGKTAMRLSTSLPSHTGLTDPLREQLADYDAARDAFSNDLRSLVLPLFDNPKPPVSEWPIEVVERVLKAIYEYFQSFTQKKTEKEAAQATGGG